MPEAPQDRVDTRALEDHIAKVIAGWPPLTDEQKVQLAALLRSES